jgi:hypothetical protein
MRSVNMPFSISCSRKTGSTPVSSMFRGTGGTSPITSDTCSCVTMPSATRLSPMRPPFDFW